MSALYAENSAQWLPWFRSVAGLRGDRFDFKVASSIPQNSGKTNAGIVSPKLSLIFGPWTKTEYFVNYGYGFHSNDARGTTATVDAKTRRSARSGDAARSLEGWRARCCAPRSFPACRARSRSGN